MDDDKFGVINHKKGISYSDINKIKVYFLYLTIKERIPDYKITRNNESSGKAYSLLSTR